MNLSNVFDIASSALSAQSQRLNVVASNLANAESAVSARRNPARSPLSAAWWGISWT